MTKKSTKKIEEEKEITRSEGNSTGPSQANLPRGVKGLSLHRVYAQLNKPDEERAPLPLDEDLPGMGQYYCLHCE